MRALVISWDDAGLQYDHLGNAGRHSQARESMGTQLFDCTAAIMEAAAVTLGDLRAKYLVLHAALTHRELPYVGCIVSDGECNWISLLKADADRFGLRLGEFWMAGRAQELKFDGATLAISRWMEFWRE